MTDPAGKLAASIAAAVAEFLRATVGKELAANDDYLSASDAAKVAGVSPRTVRNWIHDGKLPVHRAGKRPRVKRSDLVALLERGPRGASASVLTPEEQARRDFG